MTSDLFGKDSSALREKRLFLFDLDGTIYEDYRVFDGTIELLHWIHEVGGEYCFITNNSSKSVNDYLAKMKKMKIPAGDINFFTSSQATALYLIERYKEKCIYCVGTKSLLKELQDYGLHVCTNKESNPDVVVVGFDTELTYKKLQDTCELLFRGLPYIATNPDKACPTSFGFIPDCGAICEAIYFATQKRPLYIGKPEPIMVEYVLKKLSCSKEETVIIGDRLYTDIMTGINARVDTICVLTGETKWDDLCDSDIKPDYVFKDVQQIYQTVVS